LATELLCSCRVIEDTIDGARERYGIAGLDQESRITLAEGRGHFSHARSDNWTAREHRFE
jgi:hypothetical protein